MSAADINAGRMAKFRGSGIEEHTTILLGAGASITSGLPSWEEFAIRLLVDFEEQTKEKDHQGMDVEAAEILLRKQDPLIAVEAARVAAGDEWANNLRNALYTGIDDIDDLFPSPLHREAAVHHNENPGKTSLVTLNFDLLLERQMEMLSEAEQLEKIDSLKPATITDSAKDRGGYVVHHLHGIISKEEAKDVVLTLSDFNSLIEKENPWQVSYLRDAVEQGALIIAGTSYRDPDLRQWLHKALKGMPPGHKAFVLLAREAFAIPKQQFQKLEKALGDQWRAVGLEPVLLQEHTDAAQIIRELRDINKDGYLSPQDRCREIWDAHEQKFDELQRKYVEKLDEDAKKISHEVDEDSIDLTLWLSDGKGSLVRWSSKDRIYRDRRLLKAVETGHDSPWIAGQALATDQPLMENLEEDRTRRWQSVLAFPISVAHSWMAPVSSAVLTVGLSKSFETYEASKERWEDVVGKISNDWAMTLRQSVNFNEKE